MPQALTTAGSRRHSSPKLDGGDSQDRDKSTPVAAGALCRPDEQKPERYRARTINPTSNFDGHLLKWVAGGGPSERTRQEKNTQRDTEHMCFPWKGAEVRLVYYLQ